MNSNVFSSHLIWDPLDGQDETFPEALSNTNPDLSLAPTVKTLAPTLKPCTRKPMQVCYA